MLSALKLKERSYKNCCKEQVQNGEDKLLGLADQSVKFPQVEKEIGYNTIRHKEEEEYIFGLSVLVLINKTGVESSIEVVAEGLIARMFRSAWGAKQYKITIINIRRIGKWE
jgi:hypothetical protein